MSDLYAAVELLKEQVPAGQPEKLAGALREHFPELVEKFHQFRAGLKPAAKFKWADPANSWV